MKVSPLASIFGIYDIVTSALGILIYIFSCVEDPFSFHLFYSHWDMSNAKNAKKTRRNLVHKHELGKQKQNVQRLDLNKELGEVQKVTKQSQSNTSSFIPFKALSKTSLENNKRKSDQLEVSPFMKAFMRRKISHSPKTRIHEQIVDPEPHQDGIFEGEKSTIVEQQKKLSPKKQKCINTNTNTTNVKIVKRKSKAPSGDEHKQIVEAVVQKLSPVENFWSLEDDKDMFYFHNNDECAADRVIAQSFSSFHTITNPNNDTILLLMKDGGQCTLKGKYQLSSMYGIAEIFGYKIMPKDGWCHIYSAENISYMVIQAKIDTKTDHFANIKKYFTENQLNDHVEILTENTCIFLLKQLDDPMCNMVTSMQPFKNLFCEMSIANETNLSSIGVAEVDIIYDRILRFDDQIVQLAKHFRHAVKESKRQKVRVPCLVLVGGTNVGKSTLCRYIMNSTLNCTDSVMFLECDIGQTEVTSPGCVSLSMIRRPFLGPPFTHLQANQLPDSAEGRGGPVVQYFCGHVSPADDPAYYIDCLQQTIACYHDKYSHLPLIVNTMGWNKGLGLLLMLDTLKMVRPSFLAQIESRNEHRNYPSLSPEYVRQNSGWRRDLEAPQDFDYKRFVLYSVVQTMDTQHSYAPSENRDLALLAYLCGRPQNPRAGIVDIFGLVPYMVPWNAVGVRILHTAVPHQDVMYALNSSVVGMCVVPKTALQEPEDPSFPKLIPQLPTVPCHMFGVVRSIDPVRKLFYIITPESLKDLVGVNALIVGAVQTPKQLTLREGSMHRLPYVDCPQIMQSMPRRRCHQRAKLQKKNR